MPVAENCCVLPTVIVGIVGATVIDLRAAAVTDRVAEPEIEPDAALIVAAPIPFPVATPFDVIVATDVTSELHVVAFVIALCEPSL